MAGRDWMLTTGAYSTVACTTNRTEHTLPQSGAVSCSDTTRLCYVRRAGAGLWRRCQQGKGSPAVDPTAVYGALAVPAHPDAISSGACARERGAPEQLLFIAYGACTEPLSE